MIDNNNVNEDGDDEMPRLVVLRRADGGIGPDIHDPFGTFPEGIHAFPHNMNPSSHTQGRRVVRTNPPEIPTVEWVNEMINLISCYLECDIADETAVIDRTTRRWVTNRIQMLTTRINNRADTDPEYVVTYYTELVVRLVGIVE